MKELDDWVRALASEVGIDPESVDVDGVLDLAGDAAHNVVRPAAPVTTFVAGYVLGLAAADGDPDAPTSDDVLERMGAFARAWTP
ncbi:DUF6457 domain-containing protein [Luteimicrobium subarcticum]|uniref:DUF6457 domain-containing protein n=1 Tax=Luteimicrobium subarcticum TaxID=620910 RepID=A0A2M8W1W1_9MICO|nr:DUF6457 domain-containing protein [Luteimicrobium subarcticum]PJI84899.1 hypothetical protein CLV34_3146 [Luteimicrobium subarcticum]